MSASRVVRLGAIAMSVGCTGGPSADRPPRSLAPEARRVCANDPVVASSRSPLRATARVVRSRIARIGDLTVEVALTNPSPAPVRWLGTYARAGSLALEVRDSSCSEVRGGPPPMPRADDGVTGWNTLAPGASVPLLFEGWIMSDAPPGRYEVRFDSLPGDKGNSDVKSAWVPFEVVLSDGGR